MSRRGCGKNPCSRGQWAGTLCAPDWVALTVTSQFFPCSMSLPKQTLSCGAGEVVMLTKNVNSMHAMKEQDKEDKRHKIPIPTKLHMQ